MAYAPMVLLATSCVTAGTPAQCRAIGADAVPGLDSAAMCERFAARLSQTLESHGRRDLASRYDFVLQAHNRGSIQARLADTHQADRPASPPISVDVMDRAPRLSDIDGLADAVAAYLLQS